MSSISLKNMFADMFGDFLPVTLILSMFFIGMGIIAIANGCIHDEEKPRYSKLETGETWIYPAHDKNGNALWPDSLQVFGFGVDTVKPKYQLYLKKIDTLDIIVNNYLGRSMTVDNTDQIKSLFFRITRELRNDTAHIK